MVMLLSLGYRAQTFEWEAAGSAPLCPAPLALRRRRLAHAQLPGEGGYEVRCTGLIGRGGGFVLAHMMLIRCSLLSTVGI